MISYLRGKILNKGLGFVILDVRDVGYKVYLSSGLYAEIELGEEAEFYIHQHVREDALTLYGFKHPEQLDLFEMLLTVSGVGPKSALGVMAIASPADIKDSIARGDASLLVKVSGVGKKTAERVVLELRNKIGALPGADSAGGQGAAGSDEIDALLVLGYSAAQAREALNEVSPKIKGLENRIKEALKKMR